MTRKEGDCGPINNVADITCYGYWNKRNYKTNYLSKLSTLGMKDEKSKALVDVVELMKEEEEEEDVLSTKHVKECVNEGE